MKRVRLRIGVLMGGLSVEREVSFNSGRTICDHLDSTRYDVIPIFHTEHNELYLLPWRFLYRGKTSDFTHRLAEEAEVLRWCDLSSMIDFLYIAEHGRFAEDGTLQGFLEVLGVPYFGSGVFASAVCMDKMRQKDFLHMHGIEVPRGVALTPCQIDSLDDACVSAIERMQQTGIAFPCVVKPAHEGSSIGVSVVRGQSELLGSLQTACGVTPGCRQNVLIEERLAGMEFTCTVLTDYRNGKLMPLMPTEIVPDEGAVFDYEQKYMSCRASKYTPPRCDKAVIKKIQETCMDVMRALGMEWMARIDGFVTKDERVVIIDPNTLTGTTPSSFFFKGAVEHGMGHAQVINHLIETKLHQEELLVSAGRKGVKKTSAARDEKIRVAVLLGGDSDEREISLESGRNIVYKLAPAKYQAIPLFVSQQMKLYRLSHAMLVRNSTKEIASLVTPEMEVAWEELPKLVDFSFIALHGGKGENGSVQGTLEMLGLPYNGSGVLTSSLCIDKYRTAEFLHAKGFDVPKGRFVSAAEWRSNIVGAEELVEQLGLPLVSKPHSGGCSVGVIRSESVAQLRQGLEQLFVQGYESILVEECLCGMELTVGVVGNGEPDVLPPSWAVAQAGVLSIEEKFLPGCGENQTPAPLSTAALALVKMTVARAYKELGCQGYARIDCFYQRADESATGQERCVILEVNTLPGLTPATCIFHQAAEVDIKPMDFVDRIIELGFERRAAGLTAQPIQQMQKNT